MLKKYLRKEFLAKRMLLDGEEQQQRSKKITAHFTKIHLPEAAFALSYMAVPAKNEIAAAPFEKAIIHQYPQCHLCYPKVDSSDCSMEAIEYAEGMEMSKNEWGIWEPKTGNSIDPEQISVILVPLVCFDTNGYRVGYGKGFYDRFIARCRPDVITIGLSFFEPVEVITDLNEYDIPLRFCVTPESVYTF